MKVGEDTWIGPYTALDGGECGIEIGSNCSISSGVNIIGHDSVKWALSGGSQNHEYAPIRIGDNCFIGTNVVITKDVTIGNHCLVGANAVVSKSFPIIRLSSSYQNLLGKLLLPIEKFNSNILKGSI